MLNPEAEVGNCLPHSAAIREASYVSRRSVEEGDDRAANRLQKGRWPASDYLSPAWNVGRVGKAPVLKTGDIRNRVQAFESSTFRQVSLTRTPRFGKGQ